MTLRALIIPLLLALGITAAHAQDDVLCRNGLFPSEQPFALARIGGKDRVFFEDDMDGCPWRGSGCRTRSYVVPGDLVIINRTREGYVCAFYPSASGGTASASGSVTGSSRSVGVDGRASPMGHDPHTWTRGDLNRVVSVAQ